MSESDKLDGSIEHVQNKVETLKEVQELIAEIEGYAEVLVDDPVDSHQIDVYINSEKATEEMHQLTELSFNACKIEYDFAANEFKMNPKFRTDR